MSSTYRRSCLGEMSRGLGGFASEYDVFCYNKPDRESLCGRHVGCLATPGVVLSRGVEEALGRVTTSTTELDNFL